MNASTITTMSEVYRALGADATALTEEKKRSIDENGCVVFERALSSDQVAQLGKRFEKLMSQTGYQTGRIADDGHDGNIADIIMKQFKHEGYSKSKPVNELRNMVNEGDLFDILYTHPDLLMTVGYATGGRECKLSHLTAREVLPDAYVGMQRGGDALLNAIWLLDDYTEENGALTVAVGSHNKTDGSGSAEIMLCAPAGSLIILDGRTLRGEGANLSGRNKRMIVADYIDRSQPQKLNQWEFIRKTTYERISDAAKYLLDV